MPSVMMSSVLTGGVVAAVRACRDALASFEPALLSGEDCRSLVTELAAAEKACAAARARAASRAAECGAHRGAGFRDPAEWLARASGSSAGEAQAALDVASSLSSCPSTREALVTGGLSLTQAREITKAEAARPGSEDALLAVAASSDLKSLRDASRKIRLAAITAEELHARQRAARHFRHWRDDLGMVRVSGALTPEVGVALVNRLDAECDRIRRKAKADGATLEARDAYAADALAELLASGGRGRANRADVVFVCDIRAARRGHAHPGEPCHVIGGGPVPVSVIHEAVEGDAFVKAVIHDGVRIDTVKHFGRHLSAELRTALDLGTVPDFEGAECVDAGCGRRYGLEWDHDDPVANGGATTYDNVKARCWPSHRAKTERDRAAGLLGRREQRGGGKREERGPP